MKKNQINKTLEAAIQAVTGLKKVLNKDFENTLNIIGSRKGKIVVTGIGKSAFVAGKLAATLTSLGNPAIFLHPVDALHGDTGIVERGDVVIAFSFSGESVEVVKFCKYLKKTFDITLISIVGNKDSSLGKISDRLIEIEVKKEGCPRNCAPMASITASLVTADLIASGLIRDDFSKEHFSRFHPGGKLGLTFKKIEQVMSVAPLVSDATLHQAIQKINEYKKGVVGIIKNKKLVGVLTDGDVRRLFGKDGGEKAYTYMSKKPKIISAQESLLDALKKMEENKITSLFVVDKRGVVGIIHIHDIIDQYVA